VIAGLSSSRIDQFSLSATLADVAAPSEFYARPQRSHVSMGRLFLGERLGRFCQVRRNQPSMLAPMGERIVTYRDMREAMRGDDGGRAAWTQLYQGYRVRVLRFLEVLGVPTRHVEDLYQDTWATLARRVQTASDMDTPIELSLFKIAGNHARNLHKKKEPILPGEDLPEGVCESYDPVACDQFRRVMEALDSMGDKYREVFVLHEVMGFTPAEIAAIIDVPINTVRSRLGTARMQFHEACNRLGVNRG